MSQDQAEYDRLAAAIRNGPGRRIAADAVLGRPPAVADVEQAERYERLMNALLHKGTVRGAMMRPR
jgi:hypothetical protein